MQATAQTQQKPIADADPKPWIVVRDPGMWDESEVASFATYNQAHHYILQRISRGAHLDILKRLPDGNLTTEF
jgi:hypothetical protein